MALRQILSRLNVLQVLGLLDGVAAVNFSAGAFACPSGASASVVDQAPLGMVVALERLAAQRTVVAATAGNAGVDEPFFPAALADADKQAYTHKHTDIDGHTHLHTHADIGAYVIGVKALDANGGIADFSNTLARNAACALGVDVASDFPGGVYLYSAGGGGIFDGAAVWSGTSFATPHITAGFARLVADGVSVEDAIAQLRNTCPEGR